MATTSNFFRQTISGVAASSSVTVTELNESFRYDNERKQCNFLLIVNDADNKVYAELNNNSKERFPISPNGGSLTINPDDMILYDSLRIIEEDGNTVTGNIKVTGAVL